jgi:hypothetical protein
MAVSGRSGSRAHWALKLERNGELRAMIGLALHRDGASHRLHQRAGDPQAEAEPAEVPGGDRPLEALEMRAWSSGLMSLTSPSRRLTCRAALSSLASICSGPSAGCFCPTAPRAAP